MCLLANDEKVCLSENKIFLKQIVLNLKKIVDIQVEQIKDNEMLTKF